MALRVVVLAWFAAAVAGTVAARSANAANTTVTDANQRRSWISLTVTIPDDMCKDVQFQGPCTRTDTVGLTTIVGACNVIGWCDSFTAEFYALHGSQKDALYGPVASSGGEITIPPKQYDLVPPANPEIQFCCVGNYGYDCTLQFQAEYDYLCTPYVPPSPTPTATAAPTPTASPSPTATPTATPTASPSPTATASPSPTATVPPTPTATAPAPVFQVIQQFASGGCSSSDVIAVTFLEATSCEEQACFLNNGRWTNRRCATSIIEPEGGGSFITAKGYEDIGCNGHAVLAHYMAPGECVWEGEKFMIYTCDSSGMVRTKICADAACTLCGDSQVYWSNQCDIIENRYITCPANAEEASGGSGLETWVYVAIGGAVVVVALAIAIVHAWRRGRPGYTTLQE